MTNGQLANKIIKELQLIYGEREARALQRYLFIAFGNRSMTEWLLDFNKEATDEFQQKVNNAIKDLKNYKPVQYITGKATSNDLDFELTPDVLIPRPETEELVDTIVKRTDDNLNYKVLDIGTGSGIIAVSLAKLLPKVSVSAIDISKEALRVANRNAIKNNVQVEFILVDILRYSQDESTGKISELGIETERVYDIIVSNPPYVKQSEKSLMAKNVINHEPHLALFVPDADPLLYYKAIINFSKRHLTSYGTLYFEINESEDENLKALLEKNAFGKVEIFTDFNGKPRFISAKKIK